MQVPQDRQTFLSRLNQAKQQYAKRDQLIMLCNEMYQMKKAYSSTYLGSEAVAWRNRVSSEYWQSDNRPHNVVDVLTAVLGGNPPQWRATVGGSEIETLPTRAEKFLAGVFELNSLRQQFDVYGDIIFRTVLDGGVGIRMFWDTESGPPANIDVVDAPDAEGETMPVVTYDFLDFPIVIEVVPLDTLYPMGRGRMGRPFDEIFHSEDKTPNEVFEEWDGVDGADLSHLNEHKKEDQQFTQYEYIEWWGQEKDGQVWYACAFDNKFIIAPKKIDYPTIPYVITSFKVFDRRSPDLERLPFMYPLLWATQKKEYLTSRGFRLADLFGNMPPIYRGDNPVQLEGTWGDALNMGPEDSLEFIKWPGQPPDIFRMIEEATTAQAEGTFSSAMFGQTPSRMSGYALSQLVGSDTLRTDIPRRNIELALALAARVIFGLMQKFSPTVAMGINVVVKNKKLAAMLNGEETKKLTLSAAIKPKHVADEIRLASLGVQLASSPNSPVSIAYILEHYFGLEQPEDEINRKLSEKALQDPVINLIALHDALQEAGHFAAGLVEQQLKEAMQKAAAPEQAAGGPAPPATPGGPPGMQPGPDEAVGLGLGLPQAIGGNPPVVPPSGNVVEEAPPTPTTQMMGGPTE
jgi:hypothetical protein